VSDERHEIKPCPFCGKSPSVETLSLPGGRKINTVECANPDCDTVLASIWNTRPIEDALARQLTELREVESTQRVYPCGCVSCICGGEEHCFGCGARSCGQPGAISEHVPGGEPTTVWVIVAKLAELRERHERLLRAVAELRDDMNRDGEVAVYGDQWDKLDAALAAEEG